METEFLILHSIRVSLSDTAFVNNATFNTNVEVSGLNWVIIGSLTTTTTTTTTTTALGM